MKPSAALLAVLVAVVLGGCGGDDGDEGAAAPADGDEGAAAPADGAALYASACASCHGADLRGSRRGPSHLSIVYEPGHHPDESFVSAIKNGVRAHHFDFGNMPPIPGLNDDEIRAIISYVRAVQEEEGFER